MCVRVCVCVCKCACVEGVCLHAACDPSGAPMAMHPKHAAPGTPQHSPHKHTCIHTALHKTHTQRHPLSTHTQKPTHTHPHTLYTHTLVCLSPREELPQRDAVGVHVCRLADVAVQQRLWGHVGHGALLFQGDKRRENSESVCLVLVASQGDNVTTV